MANRLPESSSQGRLDQPEEVVIGYTGRSGNWGGVDGTAGIHVAGRSSQWLTAGSGLNIPDISIDEVRTT